MRFTMTLLCAIPITASAQFKCISADGAVTFQQAPCDKAARVERLIAPPAPPRDSAQQVADAQRRLAIDRAVVGGYPVVGMPVSALDRAMGPYDKVNQSDYGRGLEEQRIYYRDGRTWYVYTKAGAVNAVQNNEGGRRALAAAAAKQPEPCYSDIEIRNASVGIQSPTLDYQERERRAQQVERMRSCVR